MRIALRRVICRIVSSAVPPLAAAFLLAWAGCGGTSSNPDAAISTDGAVAPTPGCRDEGGRNPVSPPHFVRNINEGETAWRTSPAVVDLDRDGKKEIVAPFYNLYVYDAAGKRLAKASATGDRIYPPPVVADLDGDGVTEVVVGGMDIPGDKKFGLAVYEWKARALSLKRGWPVSTCSAGECSEVMGLGAADLDGDGRIEVAAVTGNAAKDAATVFVFTPDGALFQPKGTTFPAWPRYNTRSGAGGDAGWNGVGNHGDGSYGENLGIGNIDDDPALEILITNDAHNINAFKIDGTSVLASPWYLQRLDQYRGQRMGWGQFIRWRTMSVEDNLYHFQTGPWPDVDTSQWLQWTYSPPTVADLDDDGKNEVVGIPSSEQYHPYQPQGYTFVVLEGAHGDGSRSGRRKAGFETMPFTGKPVYRPPGDNYPPDGILAPTIVNVLGDPRPEIVAPINDGKIWAVGPDGAVLWQFDYAKGVQKTYASEVAAADLNRDGVPELIFGTYALAKNAGRLVILTNNGRLLSDTPLPGQGSDGNGIGIGAAPTVSDLDGDGQLEILVATFDHGIDVFTVPGSGGGCLPWPTGRGGYTRTGMGPSTAK